MKYLIFLFFYTGSLFANDFLPLQKALNQYDPIIAKNVILEGRLHFPEVQKILPDFYQQLFDRVNIHLKITRDQLKINLEGKSEHLKELVRQQFLQIEENLKTTFLQVLKKDPLYRLKHVTEAPSNYKAEITSFPSSTEYQFTQKKEKKSTLSPQLVAFEINEEGVLKKMNILDHKTKTEIRFKSIKHKDRLYFTQLQLIQSRHGIQKYRHLKIEYGEINHQRYPKRIILTETDSQGQLKLVSGHLNPVSMLFKGASFTDKKTLRRR